MSTKGEEEKVVPSDVKVDGHDSELSSVGDDSLELTPAEERRLRRKVDWRILPYCSLLYLLSACFSSRECMLTLMLNSDVGRTLRLFGSSTPIYYWILE